MLAIDTGDIGAAREWLEAHDRWAARSGSPLGRADGALAWAVYHRATGDKEAFRRAREALAQAVDPRQPLTLLVAYRLVGELETDAEHFSAATEHLATALALADACAAPYERALALLALAELQTAIGDVASGQAALEEARAICERLGAHPALVRAAAIADRLARAQQTSPASPSGLTAREVEVLRLLAAGRTNRAIADALFLSPATVNIHVTRILAKTDSANRTEAAAFAHRHGLA